MKKNVQKIAYVFKNGRKLRLNSHASFPSEFFYGFFELKKQGYNFDFLESADLGINPKLSLLASLFNKLSLFVPNFPFGSLFYLFNKKFLGSINSFDVIIPTTNTFGLLISLGKRLNFIKTKIVFISMGVLNDVKKKWHFRLIEYLFSEVKIVCLSKAEKKYLEKKLSLKVTYVPFGVDINFWRPIKIKKEPFVMAIGNDFRD